MNTQQQKPNFRDICFAVERMKRRLQAQGKATDIEEIRRLVATELKKPRAQ